MWQLTRTCWQAAGAALLAGHSSSSSSNYSWGQQDLREVQCQQQQQQLQQLPNMQSQLPRQLRLGSSRVCGYSSWRHGLSQFAPLLVASLLLLVQLQVAWVRGILRGCRMPLVGCESRH
jgi:hypothetical protein